MRLRAYTDILYQMVSFPWLTVSNANPNKCSKYENTHTLNHSEVTMKKIQFTKPNEGVSAWKQFLYCTGLSSS